MQWLDDMNRAVEYLESRMTGEVDIDEAARVAMSSRFHFQRMFGILCGMPVGEYVRSRRLSLAAQELAVGNVRVLDVALKYGYETPEAFAKAFRSFHGISPSASREPGVRLCSVSRISFVLTVKGVSPMEYKIINREAFRVVGYALRVPMHDAGHSVSIPQFWQDVMADGRFQALMVVADSTESLGMCANFAPDMSSFDYIVGVYSRNGAAPEGAVELVVNPQRWAVFEAKGMLPQSIQDLNTRVFGEWFPSSGFEHAEAPDFELYSDEPNTEELITQLWVPVK